MAEIDHSVEPSSWQDAFAGDRDALTPEVIDNHAAAKDAAQVFDEVYGDNLLSVHEAVWDKAVALLVDYGQPRFVKLADSVDNDRWIPLNMENRAKKLPIPQLVSTGLLTLGEPQIIGEEMASPVISVSTDGLNPVKSIRMSRFSAWSGEVSSYHNQDVNLGKAESSKLLDTMHGSRFSGRRQKAAERLGSLLHNRPELHIWTGFAISNPDLVRDKGSSAEYNLYEEGEYHQMWGHVVDSNGGFKPQNIDQRPDVRSWVRPTSLLPADQVISRDHTAFYIKDAAAFQIPGRDTFRLQRPSVPSYELPPEEARLTMSAKEHAARIDAQLAALGEAQAPTRLLGEMLANTGEPLRGYSAFREDPAAR